MNRLLLFFFLTTCFLTAAGAQTASEADGEDPFAAAINALTVKSFKKKSEAIAALEAVQDPRTASVLSAMLEARLYYRKRDKRVVFAQPDGDDYLISDVRTGEELGSVGKRAIKKITVNNKLRKQLRGAIARLSLASADANVRLAAVNEIITTISPESVELLRSAVEHEDDEDVLEAMRVGLALIDIDHSEKETRLTAIQSLGESLNPAARNRLAALLERNADDTFVEPEPQIRAAAETVLKRINSKLAFYGFLETVFFGLSLGSVLLLAAIGLAITFGVMGVINMAHGELIMLGAYTTYVVQLLMPNHIDMSLFVAIPAAFIVAGLVGILIERGVIRFLYGRPLETLLATFGVSLILQQLVRTIFSPLNRSVETPSWMSGVLEINSALSLTFNRLYIIIFSLVVFFALMSLLKKTVFGLQMRAVTQNRAMAKAMGIRSTWVDALTFGLGSGVAGVAGVALSQLTNVGPNLGQSYIIDSFMVVVFGGVGNLWGTLVGALSLGVVNKFLEPWAGAVLAKILMLVFIILFIQKRPRGLFPQKGRAAES